MKEFMSTFKFIISFLVLTIIFNLIFGQKVATRFLQLVLCSMLVLNIDSLTAWLDEVKPFSIEKE